MSSHSGSGRSNASSSAAVSWTDASESSAYSDSGLRGSISAESMWRKSATMATTRSRTAFGGVSVIADMGLPPPNEGRQRPILRLRGAHGALKFPARGPGYRAARDEKNRVKLHAVNFGDGGADISNAGGAGTVHGDLTAVHFGRDTDKVSRCPTIDRKRRDYASRHFLEPIGDRTFQILRVMLDAGRRGR